MTSQDQTLNTEQQELVAVGASIGAGCQPCLSHHLLAGVEAGLDGEQLLAAVASGERVSAEATVATGDHARATLGASVSSPALLSRLEEALASLGAALGANDTTNIERQLRAAAELGATRSQLQQAIDTAHNVQEDATRIHLHEAERLLDELNTPSVAPSSHSSSSCGCGGAEAPADAPKEPTATESVSATTGGCGPSQGKAIPGGFAAMMAAFCGPSSDLEKVAGSAAAMETCRQMFQQRSSESAPAASTTAASETSTPGHGCGEEAGR